MCPVGAITMGETAAVINREICIECFCCHEACPHGAIGEKPTMLYRIMRWRERRKLAR
jgi:Fe-S-cluster-containing hydrogenase component 2